MEYILTVFDKRHIKLLISSLVTLILGLILVLIGVTVSSKQRDQNFQKRWCDDRSYAQVSAFFSEIADFNQDGVKELKYKIDNKLTLDALSPASVNGRLWVYAYCANGKVSISSSSKSVDVKAIGIGGDFFLFHPLELLSGSYINDENGSKDLVVLDENTAWALFGSNDIVGQIVEIGGKRHVVSGVVKKDSGRLNDLAGNKESIIYMSYESLSENGNVSYINTYEALMPNPLTGYAREVLKELAPGDENRIEVIENSERFRWTKLLKLVKGYGTRSMNPKGVIYPYWENVARGIEDYLAPLAVAGLAFFSYTILTLIYMLIRMWKKRMIHFADIKDFVERKLEERRERKKEVKEGVYYE